MAKIIFLVTQSEFGGAQRYIFEMVSNLNRKQYEILVAAGQGDGELFKKLQNINIKKIPLEQLKRVPWPWQVLLVIKEIRNLLKKEKPDFLFLCSTTAGLLGSIAGFLLKIKNCKLKIIYRIGGWAFRDPRGFWKNWFILLAEKITGLLKDAIIVNSEIDRKLVLKYKIVPAKKIFKIYNGLNPESLNFLSRQEARERLNLEQSAKIVGTVANFYKTKGLKYFIEAANKLIEVKPQSVFVIIGDGRLRPELEAQIKKYNLENKVFLIGRIPDAYKYLKAFDVFVLPSLKEGFPWIILEAAAAELPIVATKVGAIPEILEEEILVEPGNSQVLAKKISWMIEYPTKAKLKQKFSSQKMKAETLKVLSQLQSTT